MNPEQLEQFNTLVRKVNELYEWMQQKKLQQISFPLDEASKNTISESGPVLAEGAGTATLTQQIALTGNAQNIDVPAAYAGTEQVRINGTLRTIPYLS